MKCSSGGEFVMSNMPGRVPGELLLEQMRRGMVYGEKKG